MMHAYDENLLYKAQITLANMLDVAVHTYGYDLDVFYLLFLNSDYCKRFERGASSVVAGMSGTELAYYVIAQNEDIEMKDYDFRFKRSVEYWIGWSLCFYQWYSGKSFKEINEIVNIGEFEAIYSKYHEMDIMQLVDLLEEKSKVCKEVL